MEPEGIYHKTNSLCSHSCHWCHQGAMAKSPCSAAKLSALRREVSSWCTSAPTSSLGTGTMGGLRGKKLGTVVGNLLVIRCYKWLLLWDYTFYDFGVVTKVLITGISGHNSRNWGLTNLGPTSGVSPLTGEPKAFIPWPAAVPAKIWDFHGFLWTSN